MNPEQFMDVLNEIEEKFPVEEWMLEGFHIWPLLRVGAAFQLDEYAPGKKEINYFSQALSALKDQVRIAQKNLTDKHGQYDIKKGAEVVFLTNTLERNFPLQGRMYNAYCDPIIENLTDIGVTCCPMEYTFTGSYHSRPRYSPSIYVQNDINKMALKGLLTSRPPQQLKTHLPHFAELEQFTASLGPCAQSLNWDSLLKRVHPVRLWAELFKEYFAKLRPKLGFVVCYYNPIGQAFCLACQEYGIPSVDIQHGVEGELHPGYGRYRKVPHPGYELMPDFFWNWTEYDTKAVAAWSAKTSKHAPLLGGNVLLESVIDQGTSLHREFFGLGHQLRQQFPGDLQILLTLQPVNGMTSEMRELIARGSKGWMWWVRLHPMEKNRISTLKKELAHFTNVCIREATETPLYALLNGVIDLHITESSSVVIEAEKFGIPSIVMHPLGSQYYPQQLENGNCVLIQKPHEIINYISNNRKNRVDPIKSQMDTVRGALAQLIEVSGIKPASE